MAEEIKRIVSAILRDELKDPDIPTMTSVLIVDVTRDLRYAKVRVSVMGSQEEQEKAIRALTRSRGYVRHLVSERLTIRYVPEIVFELDQSISHSIRVSQILGDIKKSENEKQPSDT
ncbi:MAG: 30S ribosome-binding factor RbfA [Clostridiales bacterium]|nr:30S ribosome-binding factor RbfA [Clostridiales bacterium]